MDVEKRKSCPCWDWNSSPQPVAILTALSWLPMYNTNLYKNEPICHYLQIKAGRRDKTNWYSYYLITHLKKRGRGIFYIMECWNMSTSHTRIQAVQYTVASLIVCSSEIKSTRTVEQCVLELAAFTPPNTSKCEASHIQMPVGSVVKMWSYSMTVVVLRIFHKWDEGALITPPWVHTHIYILITTICLDHSRVRVWKWQILVWWPWGVPYCRVLELPQQWGICLPRSRRLMYICKYTMSGIHDRNDKVPDAYTANWQVQWDKRIMAVWNNAFLDESAT
jgi:hypothetical protein